MTRPAANPQRTSNAGSTSSVQTALAIGLAGFAGSGILALSYAWLEPSAVGAGQALRGSLLLLPATTTAGGAAICGWLLLGRAERRARAITGLLGLLVLLAALSALGWKLAQ